MCEKLFCVHLISEEAFYFARIYCCHSPQLPATDCCWFSSVNQLLYCPQKFRFDNKSNFILIILIARALSFLNLNICSSFFTASQINHHYNFFFFYWKYLKNIPYCYDFLFRKIQVGMNFIRTGNINWALRFAQHV